jgi:hypothetical protein
VPPPAAELLPTTLGPYLAVLIAGFLIGWYGHGARRTWLIALGIALILLSVVLLQVAIAMRHGRAPTGF